MDISEAYVGQNVYFGRPNGQKTLGKVLKVNRKKLKVQTLESRGHRVTSGETWVVPPSLCTPADGGRPPQVTKTPSKAAGPDYTGLPESQLLRMVQGCYAGLSPENLYADGLRSRTQARREAARLNRELKACFQALGRTVSENEAYESCRTY